MIFLGFIDLSFLTQDMFSVQLEFEYSDVEISILLETCENELVIYLENDCLQVG